MTYIIILKWIKNLNVRSISIKLLEEIVEGKPLDIGFGNDFFGYDTKNTGNNITNKLVGLYETKIFYTAKETMDKTKGHPAPSGFTP